MLYRQGMKRCLREIDQTITALESRQAGGMLDREGHVRLAELRVAKEGITLYAEKYGWRIPSRELPLPDWLYHKSLGRLQTWLRIDADRLKRAKARGMPIYAIAATQVEVMRTDLKQTELA
jgi:hypothetical protein